MVWLASFMVVMSRLPALLEEAHTHASIGGCVKIDVEHAGQPRMIYDALKLNIDLYQHNETQLLTEAIFD